MLHTLTAAALVAARHMPDTPGAKAGYAAGGLLVHAFFLWLIWDFKVIRYLVLGWMALVVLSMTVVALVVLTQGGRPAAPVRPSPPGVGRPAPVRPVPPAGSRISPWPSSSWLSSVTPTGRWRTGCQETTP
jgi:hypothetical protein